MTNNKTKLSIKEKIIQFILIAIPPTDDKFKVQPHGNKHREEVRGIGI